METLNKKPVIFLVDDDRVFATALSHLLSGNNNEEINVYSTGEECLKHIHEQPDIVILDYKLNCHLPDAMNGMEVLKKIKNLSLNTEVIMLSSQDNVDV